jgi:hypothetical protein
VKSPDPLTTEDIEFIKRLGRIWDEWKCASGYIAAVAAVIGHSRGVAASKGIEEPTHEEVIAQFEVFYQEAYAQAMCQRAS